MVSCQAPISDYSTKKRKWEELKDVENLERSSKEARKSKADIELYLDPPLPVEWQQCLDIQSGEIHFYNIMTKKRTSRDPRNPPLQRSKDHLTLDLELNLTSASVFKPHLTKYKPGSLGRLTEPKSLSWLPFEEEEEDDREMVASVCLKCHLLVILHKSFPCCPNCKFMHSLNHSPPTLFNTRYSLLGAVPKQVLLDSSPLPTIDECCSRTEPHQASLPNFAGLQ